MNRHRSLVAGMLCVLLAGCFGGGKGALVRSEAEQRIERLLERGIRADAKGNEPEALELIAEAAALSAAVENRELRARSLVNLARLKRLGQDTTGARADITTVMRIMPPDSPSAAEALHEWALLELAAGNTASALAAAQKAFSAEKGPHLGRRLNLIARLQLHAGDSAAAALTAAKALVHNRDQGGGEEEANSLRIMGIARRAQKLFSEAETLLLRALDLDRNGGRSLKIASDLEELSLTTLNAGNRVQGLDYLHRAYEVNVNSGRLARAAANLELMAQEENRYGNTGHADELRRQAEKLRQQASQPGTGILPATTSPSSKP